MNDLHALRSRIKTQRQALSIEDQHQAALDFCHNLLASKALDSAEHIAVYLAHQGELNLQPTIDALWQQGKALYLPTLNQHHLLFKLYTPESYLHPNRFGIIEVSSREFITPEKLDAALVPLVAFDQEGHRIGMGKGYYDRSFSMKKKPLLIGCGYAFQEIPTFTPQSHDIKMDHVITPFTLL